MTVLLFAINLSITLIIKFSTGGIQMTSFASFFTEITAQEAKKCLEVAEGFILFIGRPSCPYCRRFEPKLTQVAKDNQLTVYFVDSEAADSDIQDLRTAYNVSTVPGLLVAKAGHVKVVCDSSLSEEAILDFIKN